jgi:hypothetical protein
MPSSAIGQVQAQRAAPIRKDTWNLPEAQADDIEGALLGARVCFRGAMRAEGVLPAMKKHGYYGGYLY